MGKKLWEEKGLKEKDWAAVPAADFVKWHNRIERAIGKAGRGKAWISDDRFEIIWRELEACAEELVESLLANAKRDDPDLEADKIDTCWMAVFALGLICHCWSTAVARGKSVDRKRSSSGRMGWRTKLEGFPEVLGWIYRLGNEIGTSKVAAEGDLDLTVQMRELTKAVTIAYRRK